MSFVHRLYIGMFEQEHGSVRFAKPPGSPFMKPVVRCPVDTNVLERIADQTLGQEGIGRLTERGISLENGYLTFDHNTLDDDAVCFIRLLMEQLDCVIVDFTGRAIPHNELSSLSRSSNCGDA